jgi:copper(I)-binding protein
MRNYVWRHLLFSAAVACWPLAVMAADAGLTIESPWARPAAVGQMGVIYLTVKDTGAPDRLIGVKTPVADEAQLHESKMDGNVMEMRPVQAAPVAPGQPLVLAPGGYHIMLMDLKQPLKVGDAVPVTLIFEKAGSISATATVQRDPPKP